MSNRVTVWDKLGNILGQFGNSWDKFRDTLGKFRTNLETVGDKFEGGCRQIWR